MSAPPLSPVRGVVRLWQAGEPEPYPDAVPELVNDVRQSVMLFCRRVDS